MRNRIAYTATLPSGDDFVAINVSRLIAEKYQSGMQDLILDPFTELNKAIRSQVPQGYTRVCLSNFGILVEPEMKLTPSRLLLNLAVDYDLILLWEGSVVQGRKLVWGQSSSASGIEFPENILIEWSKMHEISKPDSI